MTIDTVIFDLGDTIIKQVVDTNCPLNKYNLKLLPNAKPVLESLSARFKLGLLTNTTQSTTSDVREALQKISIDTLFDAILTSYEFGVEKPDLSIFKFIVKQLDTECENVLMIGNDFEKDIKPASKLGMKTGFFTTIINPKNKIPNFQFSHFADLPNCIDRLEEECVKQRQNIK